MLFSANAAAGVGGSVSGTVKDQSNAVIAQATVIAAQPGTGSTCKS